MKTIFFTNGHYSVSQKSTDGSNKIDNKERDYRYSKAPEFNQNRTITQQPNTSQRIHKPTQQSVKYQLNCHRQFLALSSTNNQISCQPATAHSTSATVQPSSESSKHHTIKPEHSTTTLLKKLGVKKKLKSR